MEFFDRSRYLAARHGCLLAASGLLLALGQGGSGAGRAGLLGSGDVAAAAVSVVLQLEKARLYRGRGGAYPTLPFPFRESNRMPVVL